MSVTVICSRCSFTQLETHKKFWNFFVPIWHYAQQTGLNSKRYLCVLKIWHANLEFSSSTDCFRDIKNPHSFKHHLCRISTKTFTDAAFYLFEFQEMEWNCSDKSEVVHFFSWITKQICLQQENSFLLFQETVTLSSYLIR